MSAELAVVVERQVTVLYDSLRVKFADSKLSVGEGYLLAVELVGGITQIHAKMVAEGKPVEAVRVACHAAIDSKIMPLLHQGFDLAYDRFVAGTAAAEKILTQE